MLHAFRNAHASILDKRALAHYKEQQRLLISIIEGPPPQDVVANREAVVSRLGAMGAVIKRK